MRLVKALRRGSPVLVAALLGSSCVDERPARPTAADCEPTLRLPLAPRIVEVLDDGSLKQGPACGSANCLAGRRGAWGYRDERGSHVVVGTVPLELPPLPASRLAAQHGLRGFVLGNGFVGVDRGAEIEIVSPTGSRRLPMPALAHGETIGSLHSLDGGLQAFIGGPGERRRTALLLPLRSAAPAGDVRPIADDDAAVVGWLVRGPAPSILTSSGASLPLAPELSSARGAAATGGLYVVFGKAGQAWLVSSTGATIAPLPCDAHVEAWAGSLYVVDVEGAGAILVLRDGVLEPLFARAETQDLAGAPLPPGARVERVEARVQDGRVLLVERVRMPTCTVEDRLVHIDLAARRATTLAGGDVVRLHPTFAGDRFRFIEADASYETP